MVANKFLVPVGSKREGTTTVAEIHRFLSSCKLGQIVAGLVYITESTASPWLTLIVCFSYPFECLKLHFTEHLVFTKI